MATSAEILSAAIKAGLLGNPDSLALDNDALQALCDEFAIAIVDNVGGGGELLAADDDDVLRWFASAVDGGTVVPNIGSGGSTTDDLNRTAQTNHGGPYANTKATAVTASTDACSGRTCRYESGLSAYRPSLSNGFTWSGWIRTLQALGSGERIAYLQHAPNALTPYTFGFDHNGGGQVRGVLNGGATSTVLSTNTDLAIASGPNTWNHIGITLSDGSASATMKLYINGQLHDSATVNSAPSYGPATGPWNYSGYSGNPVGSNEYTGLYYDWRVAEVERDIDWFKAMFVSGQAFFPN